MNSFTVNFSYNVNKRVLVNKIKNKLAKYNFCLLKKFNNLNTQKRIFYIIKKIFSSTKEIKISGKFQFKMKGYRRLDIGDTFKNTRFSRFIFFSEWEKKNDIFFKLINPVIEIRNLISGIRKENNIYHNLKTIKSKKDNNSKYYFCDFVRMIQYPTGGGFLSKHNDYDKYYPKNVINAVLPITVKKGKKIRKLCDYEEGGFYFFNRNKKINIDNYVETGDLLLFNTKVFHGVNSIDPQKQANLKKLNGRVTVVFSVAKFFK